MAHEQPEADWKVFRELRRVALNRLCERTLAELRELSAAESKTPHERYLAVFERIHARDDEIANCFNDVRRSRMRVQLNGIIELGLLTEAEFAQFTAATQESVTRFRTDKIEYWQA